MATRQAQSRQSYGGSQLALENNPHLLAVPAGGTTGQVLAKTSGTDYATGWVTASGGSPARATATFTTSGSVAGTNYTGTITMATGYRLLAVQTSAAARVRVYTDTASMTADTSRAITTAVPDNAGLVLEYLTVNTAVQKLSPVPNGYSMETTPTTAIPIVVTPTGATAVTVTVTYVATE
jgi:hypothetical protein